MKHVLIIFATLLLNHAVAADLNEAIQKNEKTAEELKALYPENDLVYRFIHEEISFDWDKRSESEWPINAYVSSEGHAVCLSTGCSYQYPIFYDNYSEIDKVQVVRSNGRTTSRYNIPDLQYESSGIFHNDVRYKLINKKIPDFGALSGFSYEKTYTDLRYLTSTFLLEPHPVVERKISIEIPEWLDMEIREFHLDQVTYYKKVETTKNSKIIHYRFSSLPESPRESMSPGPSYYLPHLVFVFHKATDPKKGGLLNMFSSAGDLYNWYHELVSGVTNRVDPLKPTIKSLVHPDRTDEENMASLYYWVQDNIRYIAFEDGIAGYQPEEASQVYHKRYGDCKGMANLLASMLKEAGYDARLVWLGTNHIYYDYSLPSLCVDNHMICAVIHNGETIFLDPTEEFNKFGDLAHRIQGRSVLIQDGDQFILDTIPKLSWHHNKEVQEYEFTLQANTLLTGLGSHRYEGESKTRLLRNYNTTGLDKQHQSLANFLSGRDKNLKITDIEHSQFSERDSILSIRFSLVLTNHTIPLDNEIYVDLDFEKPFQSFNIEEDRVSPIAFDRKYDIVYRAALTIPENLTVDHTPASLEIDHPAYQMMCSYTQKGNQIIYERNIVIKTGTIAPKYFHDWNVSVGRLDKFYKDLIVLKTK